jgi:hypothetical protein
MTPRTSSPGQDPAASRAIDVIIEAPGDWRSTTLARLRAVILSADASIVEEVKWKKPSRPMGVPVWSRDGNICIGEALKSAVRLTFPKGALLTDPKHVFNARLDSADPYHHEPGQSGWDACREFVFDPGLPAPV